MSMKKWQKKKTEQLVELFQKAPIVRTMGMQLAFTDDARAKIYMPYNPAFDHGLFAVHGGVYMTLLDNAGWFTSAANIEDNIWVATSSISIQLLRPVKKMGLLAEGWLLKSGKRQDYCEMKLFDDQKRLVAHAIGVFTKIESIDYDPEVMKRF